MSQLDEGSRVLSGIESRERIEGGEREKRLKHVYVGSSQSSPELGMPPLSLARKQHPGCIQGGPYASWFFV